MMVSLPTSATASTTATTGMSTTTTGMVPPAASSIPVVPAVSIALIALPTSLVAAIFLGTLIILRLEPIISIGVVCLLRVLPHVVILLHVKMHRRQLPVAHKTTGSLRLEFGIALEGHRRRTKTSVRVFCLWFIRNVSVRCGKR